MEMSPEIKVLVHNEEFGIWAIEIPAGVANPVSTTTFDINSVRYVAFTETSYGSSSGTKAEATRWAKNWIKAAKARQAR